MDASLFQLTDTGHIFLDASYSVQGIQLYALISSLVNVEQPLQCDTVMRLQAFSTFLDGWRQSFQPFQGINDRGLDLGVDNLSTLHVIAACG